MTTDKQQRKERPIARGVLDYFPDAIGEIANVSYVGNQQHNPGEPLHWAKGKSDDHADALVRHLLERGTIDNDGLRHSAKAAWRALALLQTEIEAEREHEAKVTAEIEADLKAKASPLPDLGFPPCPEKLPSEAAWADLEQRVHAEETQARFEAAAVDARPV